MFVCGRRLCLWICLCNLCQLVIWLTEQVLKEGSVRNWDILADKHLREVYKSSSSVIHFATLCSVFAYLFLCYVRKVDAQGVTSSWQTEKAGSTYLSNSVNVWNFIDRGNPIESFYESIRGNAPHRSFYSFSRKIPVLDYRSIARIRRKNKLLGVDFL